MKLTKYAKSLLRMTETTSDAKHTRMEYALESALSAIFNANIASCHPKNSEAHRLLVQNMSENVRRFTEWTDKLSKGE